MQICALFKLSYKLKCSQKYHILQLTREYTHCQAELVLEDTVAYTEIIILNSMKQANRLEVYFG